MPVENAEVARLFRRAADLLELKGENPFRIRYPHRPGHRMARADIRHLVVLGEDNNVAGLLSLDDVLHVMVGETAAIGRLLERQKPRVPA